MIIGCIFHYCICVSVFVHWTLGNIIFDILAPTDKNLWGPIYLIKNFQGPDLPGPNFPGPNLPGPNLPGSNLPGPNSPGPNMLGPNIPAKNTRGLICRGPIFLELPITSVIPISNYICKSIDWFDSDYRYALCPFDLKFSCTISFAFLCSNTGREIFVPPGVCE